MPLGDIVGAVGDVISSTIGTNEDAVASIENLYNSDGTYNQPEAIDEPGTMGFSPYMTELQRRSAIATGGVAGTDSTFRDETAQEYYINLLLRSIIDDQGAVSGDFTDILPIELQYMRQVLGLDVGNSIESLIDAFDPGPGPSGDGTGGDDGEDVGDDGDTGTGIDTGIGSDIFTAPNPDAGESGGDTDRQAGNQLDQTGYAVANELDFTDQAVLGAIGTVPGLNIGTTFTEAMNYLGIPGIIEHHDSEYTLRDVQEHLDDPLSASYDPTAEGPMLSGGADDVFSDPSNTTVDPNITGSPITTDADDHDMGEAGASGMDADPTGSTGDAGASGMGPGEVDWGDPDSGSDGGQGGTDDGGAAGSGGAAGESGVDSGDESDNYGGSDTSGGNQGNDDSGSDGGQGGGSDGGGDSGSGGGDSGEGGPCFAAGTDVLMADGMEEYIENIKVGDMVMSFDTSGKLNKNKVTKIHKTTAMCYFLDGSEHDFHQPIYVTKNHPFLTLHGQFMPIGEIVEEGLPIYHHWGRETSIVDFNKDRARTVYNITVANDHTYIAGGFRVHNKLHEGGMIDESRDPSKKAASIQEVLQEGEYVIRKEVVSRLGEEFFDALNKAFAPR